MKKREKEACLRKVRKDGDLLEGECLQFRDDEDVVCAAVKSGKHESFKFASERLKNDRDFFLQKLLPLDVNAPMALEFASIKIRNDPEVVKLAVQYYFRSFVFAGEKLRHDKCFVLELMKLEKIHLGIHPSFSLRYASGRIRNDREVVLAAVKGFGLSLEYASEDLKNDKEIVREAVKSYGNCFQHASSELKKDKEFCIEMAKIDDSILNFLDVEWGREIKSAVLESLDNPEEQIIDNSPKIIPNPTPISLFQFEFRKKGLPNITRTYCYLNCGIQLLVHVPEFAQFCAENLKEDRLCRTQSEVVQIYKEMKQFVHGQDDSTRFVQGILGEFRVPPTMFSWRVTASFHCSSCGKVILNYYDPRELCVRIIPARRDLKSCSILEEVFDIEVECDLCGKTGKDSKVIESFDSQQIPNYMIFGFDRKTQTDWDSFSPLEKELKVGSSVYRIFGITVRIGGSSASSGGHFFCFVRNGDEWWKFNDSKVKRMRNPSQIFKFIQDEGSRKKKLRKTVYEKVTMAIYKKV